VGLALSIPLMSSPAQAAPKPKSYPNCAAMNKDFPKGVTYSRSRVADAVKKGFVPPLVNDAVFDKNRRLYLPGASDSPLGVVCPVVNPVAPSPAQALVSSLVTDTSMQLYWFRPHTVGPVPLVYDLYVNGSKVTEGLADTNYALSGLIPATAYVIQVIARNPIGQSTSQINVTTKAASAAPVAPAAPAGGGGTRYANCTDARAAGVTPIRRPSALYSANTHLDRDGDGIACE